MRIVLHGAGGLQLPLQKAVAPALDEACGPVMRFQRCEAVHSPLKSKMSLPRVSCVMANVTLGQSQRKDNLTCPRRKAWRGFSADTPGRFRRDAGAMTRFG